MTRLRSMYMNAQVHLFGSLTLLGCLFCANADATVTVTISGGGTLATAEVRFPRPGGGLDYQATLQLEFRNPRNVTEACLGISADLLDASGIAAINARLPEPLNLALDPVFPIVVTVEPPAACGLQFDDDVRVELHTAELLWVPFSPYRLYKAPVGGMFFNITAEVASGSVRTRGSGGSFSQFVIVKTLLQDFAAETDHYYEDLDRELARPALPASAREALRIDLSVSRAAYESGDLTSALGHVVAVENRLRRLAGAGIANTWRSQRDLNDDAGELLSYLQGLKFTLGRLSGTP